MLVAEGHSQHILTVHSKFSVFIETEQHADQDLDHHTNIQCPTRNTHALYSHAEDLLCCACPIGAANCYLP